MSTRYTDKENLEKPGKGEPWAPPISVRISPRMHKILQAECDRRGEGISAVIRRHLVDASRQSMEHLVLERVERKIDILTSLAPGSGGALAGAVAEIASTTVEMESRLTEMAMAINRMCADLSNLQANYRDLVAQINKVLKSTGY